MDFCIHFHSPESAGFHFVLVPVLYLFELANCKDINFSWGEVDNMCFIRKNIPWRTVKI